MSQGNRAVRRRKRWLFVTAWIFSVTAVCAATSAYLALRPERLRGWIQAGFASSFRQSVLRFSEPIQVDLWRMALAVKDVKVEDDGGETLLRVQRLAVLPRIPALLQGRFEPKEVVLEGPEIRLAQLPDGTWNLARILNPEALTGLGSTGRWRCPRVRLRGGRIILNRGRGRSPGEGLTNEIALRTVALEPGFPEGRVAFRAEVLHPLARRLSLSGSWDQSAGIIECQIKATKVDLATPADRLVGEEVGRELTDLQLEGLVDLQGLIRYDFEKGLLPLEFQGKFIRCQLAPPGLPFPVKGLRGSFSLRGRTLSIQDLDGTFGDGR